MAVSEFGSFEFPAGSGTATYVPQGPLTVNTTSTQTGADTNETDLWSYTLPANTLNTNGMGVRVTAWGSFATNGNTKTIRPYFAGSNLGGQGTTASNQGWRMQWVVIRTGASTQVAYVVNLVGGVSSNVAPAPAATGNTATDLVIKATGQNGTASAGDIVFRGAIVEFFPAT